MRDTARQAERLMAIRLRYTINTHLEDRGLTTPAAIGAATSLPATEAARLLNRRLWRDGDVTALKAIADRLRLDVRLEGLGHKPIKVLARRGGG